MMTNRDSVILAGENHGDIENLLRNLGLSRYFKKYTASEKDLITSVRQLKPIPSNRGYYKCVSFDLSSEYGKPLSHGFYQPVHDSLKQFCGLAEDNPIATELAQVTQNLKVKLPNNLFIITRGMLPAYSTQL